MKPVIIAVAITGSVPRKKDNPAVPVTPSEQIESTHQAFEAGASLVHIHVRNPDESSSSDPAAAAFLQRWLDSALAPPSVPASVAAPVACVSCRRCRWSSSTG
jgi:uncharacterized protein (DUF849 family)